MTFSCARYYQGKVTETFGPDCKLHSICSGVLAFNCQNDSQFYFTNKNLDVLSVCGTNCPPFGDCRRCPPPEWTCQGAKPFRPPERQDLEWLFQGFACSADNSDDPANPNYSPTEFCPGKNKPSDSLYFTMTFAFPGLIQTDPHDSCRIHAERLSPAWLKSLAIDNYSKNYWYFDHPNSEARFKHRAPSLISKISPYQCCRTKFNGDTCDFSENPAGSCNCVVTANIQGGQKAFEEIAQETE